MPSRQAIALKAEAAFDALLALDVHSAERAELLAAGVPEATAAALYPAGFIGLVPQLVAHAETISDEQLTAPRFDAMHQRADKIFALLSPELSAAAGIQSDVDGAAIRNGILEQELGAYLTGRILRVAESARVRLKAQQEPMPENFWFWEPESAGWYLARAIWDSHWLMSHRVALPVKAQRGADELMLEVADLLSL